MARPFVNLTTMWKVIDRLGDHTAIPEKYSIHILSLQLGMFDMTYKGAFDILRVWYRDPPSLFMNGVLFLQLRLPFWVGLQLRPSTKKYLQCGIGWKGNGRLAALFRVQSDESGADGMDGANSGQASGLNDGTK